MAKSKNKRWRPFQLAKLGAPMIAILVFGWLGVRFLTDSNAATVPGGPASLSVLPASTSVVQGQQVTFTVRVNTGGVAANAVRADLTYPAASLELVGTATQCANPPLDVTAENDQTVAGKITLACGSVAGFTGDQLVTTVTFKALGNSGTASITVDNAAEVLQSSDNTNILGTISGASVTLTAQPPTITTVSPSTGTSLGGTVVTITGTNFVGTPTVKFGTTNGTSVSLTSPTSIQATAPAGNPGTVAVSVTVAGQTATKAAAFTFTDTTAPSTPGTPTITNSASGRVGLSWAGSSDSGGSGLAGYRIYRNGTLLNSTSVSATTYTDTTAGLRVSYSYTIAAVDNAGNASAQSTAVSVTTKISGDISGDDKVTLTDLSILLSNWGKTTASADINKDGTINLTDLSILLANWGK